MEKKGAGPGLSYSSFLPEFFFIRCSSAASAAVCAYEGHLNIAVFLGLLPSGPGS
jgi:hypothetical protein